MRNCIINLLLIAIIFPCNLRAKPNSSTELSHKITGKNLKKKRKATIYFNFKDEDLVDIINMIAALKNVNIVLPTGANAIKIKVNLLLTEPLTLEEAWDILYTLLDIAGYSLIKKKDLYLIIKNNQNISREPLPIFINTPLSELPKTDERIVFIYYLTNIKASQEFDNQLGALFKELLPSDAIYKADKNANGILLVAKSQDIRSIMEIVEAMDQTGFQERLEMIRLRYTTSDTVARIFNEGILKTAVSTPNNRFRAGPQADNTPATYFSQNVRVISEPRTNSLVVLGRVQAVERVKDFIFKYIDTQLDSGKSILHVYELQYLDADEFAPVLQRIIDSSRGGGTEQSSAGESSQSGIERSFDKVIIRPDSPPNSSEEGAEGKYFGGNKLIIAARNDDWSRIRSLIEALDKPQPQVIIEVLIADLTLDDARALGAITRNPSDIPFGGNAGLQAAMINQVILDAPASDLAAINQLRSVDSDLNAITVPLPPDTSGAIPYVSIPQSLAPGTSVIAINDSDGRTWSLLQILKLFTSTKILTHPHIIATNNQTATISVGETRLVVDQAAPSTSGITLRKKDLDANTDLKITPRISAANTVNLQVVVDINQFNDPTNLASGDRFTRNLVTNASVKSGDILALGGLINDETSDSLLETPILSNIPIIGWMFKNKRKEVAKTSLNIFITPTIVQPKLRGGVGEYSRIYAEKAKAYTHTAALFDNLRDPITRWFFVTQNDSATIIDEFLAKDETRDSTPPNIELANLDHEDDVLDNPLSYNKSGQLKTLLETHNNPLEKTQNEYSLHEQKNQSIQQAPSNIPATTVEHIKSTQINIPTPLPTNPVAKNSTTKRKGGIMNTCAHANPSCQKQTIYTAPMAKSTQQSIPCPAKKPIAQPPKADLKAMLSLENNPLQTGDITH